MSATRPGEAAGALWDFCVAVYGRPGVADACLELQDEHGADVPLLLAALWSAGEGSGLLTGDDLTALDRVVAPWRDNVIRPLRQARRWMKAAGHADDPLRERLKAAELAAERRELEMIAAWLADGPARSGGDAAAALQRYLAWLGSGSVAPALLAAADQRRSR